MTTNPETSADPPRLRDDDKLIDVNVVRELMGGAATSTIYSDPDLMALRVYMTPKGVAANRVRFIEREILELRAKRVAETTADPEAVKAQIEKQIERRRNRQRKTQAA